MPKSASRPQRDGVLKTHEGLRQNLLNQRNAYGVWEGRLAESALSTAVAVFALRSINPQGSENRIRQGESWLTQHANDDGSWGDTTVSAGNLSTTLLALSALQGAPGPEAEKARSRAEAWISQSCGGWGPDILAHAILAHYGEDRTFSVPILTMCALAGLLGDAPGCWAQIPQLPFELALLPRWSFSLVGLPVVSYALPALISMGLARSHAGPAWWAPWRPAIVPAVMRRLRVLQPENGGFLEATPLTGFVIMSLAAAGLPGHPVVSDGCRFLAASQRLNGSWPIDTNLSTWVTTLAVDALRDGISDQDSMAVTDWLLGQQFLTRHPFTGAAAGGWGWTDLPGGVPDADDTAGALLTLHTSGRRDARTERAVQAGLGWLLNLANRDGGFPTFCRGWGRLPFDRSCPDITAHVLRAFRAWDAHVPAPLRARLRRATHKALMYLNTSQREDGAWLPLWFGNEGVMDHSNPVYGTARVLQGLNGAREESGHPRPDTLAAARWLAAAQAKDGGWGGDRNVAPSLEETALAVIALAPCRAHREALDRGVHWIMGNLDRVVQPTPIGLYFASLWYHEALYPLVFALTALRSWLDSYDADC